MPYRTLTELPSSVKGVLSHPAQKIYLAAFNHAWKQYQNPEKRGTSDDQETTAHKVAWSAVKKSIANKKMIGFKKAVNNSCL